jgi:hypothetical protein
VILASQTITIKLSILQGSATGTADYTETRRVTTNAQGLFTAVIGDTGAISTLGNFTTINWKNTPKFLKIEMDAAAGTNFITMGTTQFQYVAYAQFAKSVDAENIVGIVPVILGGTGVNNLAALKTALAIDKAGIGLSNVDNTSDLTKPISTATQTALDSKVATSTFSTTIATKANLSVVELKAPIESPTFTGTVGGITKSMVGLSGVDNTSDINKPISSATQTALDSKVSSTTFSTTLNTKVSTETFSATIATKENTVNKSTATDLGASATSDILFPTQKAVKTYVDAQINSGGVADGSITSIKLADGAITTAKIANTAVDLTTKVTGLLPTINIADAAITTAKIANSAVDLSTKVTGILPTSKGGTGTITATANTFFATPDGTSGAPSFRGILASDIPSDLSSYIQSTPMSPQSASIDIGGGARIGGRGIIGNDLYVNNIYMGIGGTSQNNTNTAIGNTSLQGQDDGYGNTTLGIWTMKVNNGGFNNTSIGAYALQNINTGNDNTAIGNYAMLNSTTGNFNTATGSLALSANTSTANTGSYNVANGYRALPFNQTGSYNVGVGYSALNSNTTGTNNTAIGNQANVSTGSLTNATAIGNAAIVSGSNQIQLGNSSVTLVKTSGGITSGGTLTANAGVFSSTTISGNASLGGTLTANAGVFSSTTISGNASISGTLSVTGDAEFNSDNIINGKKIGRGAGGLLSNTVFGANALFSNTTGEENVAIGNDALLSNTIGSYNVAMGNGSLRGNISGIGNTALGANSLYSNTSGAGNTALGLENLYYNTIGEDNFASGIYSLKNNISGSSNFASGYVSLLTNTAGNDNIAIGYYNMAYNVSGNSNVSLGFSALKYNTTGSGNVALGYGSLNRNISGSSNISLGTIALCLLNSGSNNVAIGNEAGYYTESGSNNLLLGNQAYTSTTTTSDQIVLGNSSISSLRAQVTSITALSDRRDKTDIQIITEGIDFIKQLKPVTFTWNTRDKAKVGIKSAGFIAQDLLALQKASLIGTNLDLVSEDNPEKLEARYNNLLPVMVKAIQDQQVIIEDQKKRLEVLEKLVAELIKK